MGVCFQSSYSEVPYPKMAADIWDVRTTFLLVLKINVQCSQSGLKLLFGLLR